MGIPTWVKNGVGAADIAGAWSTTANSGGGGTIGDIIIFQILQDGTTAGAVAITAVATVFENLAGTDGALTQIGVFNVGNPTAALQHLYIGRLTSTSSGTVSGTNSTSEDVFLFDYIFTGCNPGASLNDVIENGAIGATANGVGTSTTCSDTAVTTLGPDRLAVNCIGLNNTGSGLTSFLGMTGGTWTQRGLFGSATGTAGSCAMQDAPMPNIGVIDGGSDAIVSMAWGVVGFALIGTSVFRDESVMFQDPGVLAKAWERGKSGVWLPPKLWMPRPRLILT